MVRIDNFSFCPATYTVPEGAAVTWVNHDDTSHTIVNDADSRVFKSPPTDSDGTFSVTLTSAATHEYFCTFHAHGVGIVVAK